MTVREGFADEAVAAVREAAGLPTIAFGRTKRPEHAVRLLERGIADLIGIARQLMTDPEWAAKGWHRGVLTLSARAWRATRNASGGSSASFRSRASTTPLPGASERSAWRHCARRPSPGAC